MILSVFVPGTAAPQGSKRHVGRGILVESSKAVKPWRESIRWAILERWRGPQMLGPVTVELQFVMPRPASTPKRSTPPAIKRPDIDKLERAVLDAIGSAGVWKDDSQVTTLRATKRLAEIGETPGCRIVVDADVRA
ncbi:MAG: RusA family crossover junction endodeoxyribonuclease [Desulfurellales bacterium]|nr:MAG: RusA family crossover junction endodeoxyribonuclease [Desulfurellales bacterium]